MATGRSPESYAEETRSTLALKGPHTRVYAQEQCVHCLGGNASLARGGSGDLLTGIIGGLLAKQPSDPRAAALLGVSLACPGGEILNLLQGQESVFATELLDCLSCALTMTSESTNHSLLVLAAGLGTRYGGLKQMEPVGPSGRP